MTCQGFLQCTLKLLNFLVTLVGAFMILYSLWMLKEWHSDIAPPSSSDSPSPSPTTSPLDGNLARDGDFNILTSFSLPVTDAGMEQLGRPFLSYQKSTVALPDLPDPWFIYAFMAGGIFTLLVTCTGHVAAETSNSFCLSCYTVIQIVLLLVQFAIAGVLFFDSHWHEDLPDDPTGELDKIKDFLEENLDICKWVALSVVVLEVLGLFFATVLRVVSASTQRDYDSDEEYLAARASRQAAGNHQLNQATTPTAPGAPGDTRLPRKDAWSTRMRDKVSETEPTHIFFSSMQLVCLHISNAGEVISLASVSLSLLTCVDELKKKIVNSGFVGTIFFHSLGWTQLSSVVHSKMQQHQLLGSSSSQAGAQ